MGDISHADLYQQIGGLSARMTNVETNLKTNTDDTKQILATVNELRGGWKVFSLFAAGGGVAGAAIVKFLPRMFG